MLYHLLPRYGHERTRPAHNGTAQATGIFFMVALGVPPAVTAQRFGAGGVTQGEELMNDLCNNVIELNSPKTDS